MEIRAERGEEMSAEKIGLRAALRSPGRVTRIKGFPQSLARTILPDATIRRGFRTRCRIK